MDPWGAMLFGPREVERLVDRLSIALQTQTQLVRELDESRTQLAAHQAEIESARRRAERSAETLSTFLHALGHDLRAPFTTIGAGLELLALESPSPDSATRAERVASLARTCAHGLAMVDDLFELLRSDAGQWRVDLRTHRLENLAQDALALAAPRAAAKGLPLRIEWQRDELRGLRMQTDGTRIRQALANLLGNAVKFSDAGEVVLRVEHEQAHEKAHEQAHEPAHVATGPREWILLSVRDSGPGFDPSDLSAVFEPFRQSSRTERRAHEGAGLGLAIVSRCAQLLGGRATAANNDDGGACVTMRVPLVREATKADAVDAQTVSTEAASMRAMPGRVSSEQAPRHAADAPLLVLIVEDAPESLRLAAHHFTHAGCTVRCAETLAAAREALAREPFDLVVIDGELPDGRGTELLGSTRMPPVVLSSARQGVGPEALPGIADTLPKPISRESVRALLARVAARRAA